MRVRRGYLPVAALLGAFAALVPTIASSETTSISAYDEPGGYGYHSWQPSTATVGPGGVVKFINPYSDVAHGLKFTSGPATPTCTGIPAAATEPTGATAWHGECTFTTPGTYSFICTVHPSEMKGTITVSANGTITTTSTTTPTATTPGEPGSQTTSSKPLVGSAGEAIRLGSRQRGESVHGSIEVSRAGTGGRLEVDLLATSASLAKLKRPSRVTVGRFRRSFLKAGVVSFAVPLTAKGTSALRRHGRLALTVQIVLTPVHGAALRAARSVVLRP